MTKISVTSMTFIQYFVCCHIYCSFSVAQAPRHNGGGKVCEAEMDSK